MDRKHVQKYWPIILIVFFSIIPILPLGTELFMDGSLGLQIDPQNTTKNQLQTWDSENMGGKIGFGTSFLPINIFHLVLSQIIPLWIVERIFISFMILVAGLSIYKLQGLLGISKGYRIIGSVFYMYNFVPLLLLGGSSQLTLSYSFAPLLLYLTILGVHKQKFKYAVLISLSTIPFAGINPPMTVIVLSPAILYIIYNLFYENCKLKFSIGFLTIIAIISFLVNIYWLVSTYNGLVSSYSVGKFASIFVFENLNLTNTHSSYVEVFRLLGDWGFYDGWNGKWYVSYAPFYIKNSIGIFLSFLMPLIAILGLLVSKNRYKLFFGALIVIFIPLSVGAYPPENPEFSGKIFLWLYKNLPLFPAFRGTYKFSMVLALSYSILISLFSERIAERLKNNVSIDKLKSINLQRLKTGIVVSIIIILILSAYWPMWSGKIKNDVKTFRVPDYYNNLSTYVSENIGEERIMLTPHRYFSVFEWGTTGGEILSPLLKKPLIYENPGLIQDTSETGYLTNKLYSDIYNNQTSSVPQLMHILGIQYILQQNDINWQEYDSKNPQEMEHILLNINGVKKVNSFGKVDVYKISQNNPYVEIFDKVEFINNNTGRYLYSEVINKTNEDLGVGTPVYLDDDIELKEIILVNNLKKPDAIRYTRVTPTNLKIDITNATNPYIVVFKENYDNWVAGIEGNEIPTGYHFKANGFANAWYIDKKGSYEISIRYKPQQWFNYGIIISTFTLLVCFIFLFHGWWKKRNKNHEGS